MNTHREDRVVDIAFEFGLAVFGKVGADSLLNTAVYVLLHDTKPFKVPRSAALSWAFCQKSKPYAPIPVKPCNVQ